jgi:nucleoside-diphosphate-sugar epimerase
VESGGPVNVLITGGTGFVGTHLQEELERRGIGYAAFGRRDFDLLDKAQADAVFAQNASADVVVHLACYQAAAEFPAQHPGEQFFVNSQIHLNVLEGWRRHLPHAKLIGMGSSCAYPSDLAALTEDRLLDGPIHGSVYSYAFTKRLLHIGIQAYNDQYGLRGSYVIPPTLFGERDDFHVSTAHVVSALIGKFVRATQEQAPSVEIWGDGSQVREFLYVKTFVSALVDLLPVIEPEALNVAPGRGTSIRDLAEAISAAAGFRGRLAYDPSRYVGVKEKFLTTVKLEQKYGMRLPVTVADGIARTAAWYAANSDILKDKVKFSTPYVQENPR